MCKNVQSNIFSKEDDSKLFVWYGFEYYLYLLIFSNIFSDFRDKDE